MKHSAPQQGQCFKQALSPSSNQGVQGTQPLRVAATRYQGYSPSRSPTPSSGVSRHLNHAPLRQSYLQLIALSRLTESERSDLSSSNQSPPFHKPLSSFRTDQSALRLHQPTRGQLLVSDWLVDSDSRWWLQGIRGQSSKCNISANRVARGLRLGFPGRHGSRECNSGLPKSWRAFAGASDLRR